MSDHKHGPTHFVWLAKWQREVEEEYVRLHEAAARDPQLAGHGGEATWARLLEEWLPPAYEVGRREYIVPEEGDDLFETDLVVFNPGYPAKLREREEVLAGGVAAAFSVKLTIDAAALRDGAERAMRLRRSLKPRFGSPRAQLLAPFPAGLLGHSHTWTRNASTPLENLSQHLFELDFEVARSPRETLDLVCVADLATAYTSRHAQMPSEVFALSQPMSESAALQRVDVERGVAMSCLSVSSVDSSSNPVAAFVAALLVRLAVADPTLLPFADALRLTDTLGSSAGIPRFWDLDEVYDEDVRAGLPHRLDTSSDWRAIYLS